MKTWSPGMRYLAWLVIIIASGVATIVMATLTRREPFDAFSRAKSQALAKTVKEAEVTARIKKLCFVRGDWIYVTDLSTGKETKLVEGKWPDLSPNGDAVVFMAGRSEDPGNPPALKILDLRTNQTRDFNSLARVRAFGPRVVE